jgi:PAS domain S-box-containing protein
MHVSSAIARLEQMEALRSRAEELGTLQATVLDITAPYDLSTLLERIVERAARLLGAGSGGMYLCDPEKREARCVVSYNTPHDYRGVVLKYGEGAAGRVAETGRPLMVNDYRLWEGRAEVYEKDRPFSALLSAPMIWQDRVIGVIHVMEESKVRRFTQADLEMLMLFANHATIAVERTRTEEELRQYSLHLERLVNERTKELRSARERLEYVITSNPAVIYTGKPLADGSDFVLTYLSERVSAMLGFEPQDFVGHPEFWERRVHPEDLRSMLAQIPRLWKEGQYAFEYRFLHKDGTYRWIREEAKVVRDTDGKPIEVNGYWTDASERKRLEEELVRSQRLATIGETTAMVGHDLRNPLQGIAGIVYLAKRDLESRKAADRKAAAALLDTIQEQVVYMDKIVSDLQDYSQPLAPKLTEANLPNLIRQILSTIKIPETVKVSIRIEKAAENAMIDPTLMRRTLTNLTINAIQAMPKKGKLTIRARSKRDSTIMTVEDTGAGIPRKNLAKVFSPFFTTKAKGQGLGLPVCKRLVEAQGGTITVKSKPRKGTAFTIKMPRGKREMAS